MYFAHVYLRTYVHPASMPEFQKRFQSASACSRAAGNNRFFFITSPCFTPTLCVDWFVAMKCTKLFMAEQSKQCLNAKWS